MKIRQLLVGGVLGLLLAVATAAPAAAHAALLSSNPVPGARFDLAPAEVRLIFSEPVSAATVTVLDGNGSSVTAGTAGFADPAHRQVTSPLQPALPTGVYVVSWRVVSADSHPVSGAFSFGVGVAAPAESTVSGTSDSRAASSARATLHWVGFAGVAVAFGGLAFLLLVWPAGRRRRTPRLTVLAGMTAALLASIGQLLVQAPYTGQSLARTINSEFGYVVLARIGLLAVGLPLIAALLGRAGAPRPGEPVAAQPVAAPVTAARAAAAVLAVATLATWPLTGHARTGDPLWLAVGSDTVHLGAVAVWLGGVVMLVVAVLRGGVNRADVLPIVARFSPLALGCIVVIVISGTYQAWREVGTAPALLDTRYGLLLTGKIALFAVIIGLGAAARQWIRGRWGTAPAGLRRSVGLEVTAAALILALTSVLTATPPARSTYSTPLHTTVAAGSYRLEVSVEPARVGANTVQVLVRTPDGVPVDAPEVRLRITLAGPAVGPLPITAHRVAAGEFVAHDASFPFPGHWQLGIGVRTSEFDLTNAATEVTVH
jgi:copper transport protein